MRFVVAIGVGFSSLSMILFSCSSINEEPSDVSNSGEEIIEAQPSNASISLLQFESIPLNHIRTLEGFSVRDNGRQFLWDGMCSYSLTAVDGWTSISKVIQGKSEWGNSDILVYYKPTYPDDFFDDVSAYSIVVHKEFQHDTTFIGYIELCIDLADQRNEYVEQLPNIPLSSGDSSIVMAYITPERYFATAYIDEPEYIITVTLATKTSDDFRMSYWNYFTRLVKSYEYLGTVVLEG